MKKTLTLFFAFAYFISIAQTEVQVDINELINETQLSTNKPNNMNLIWWIPLEFWEASFANDPSINPSEVEAFIEVLQPYTIFAAVEGTIGPFGGITYVEQKELMEIFSLYDKKDKRIQPLNKSDLSPDLLIFLSSVKPMMENMLGSLGENMHFFIYDDMDENNNRRFDPFAEGAVKVISNDEEFKFRTPLSSLIPRKVCPADKELLNGGWKYCPWHGDKLVSN